MMEKPYTPGVQILLLFGLVIMLGAISQAIFQSIIFSVYPDGIAPDSPAAPWAGLTANLFFHLFSHLTAFFLFLRFTGYKIRGIIFLKPLRILYLLLIPVALIMCFLIIDAFTYLSTWIFEASGNYGFIEAELEHQASIDKTFNHNDPLRFTYSLFVVAILPAIGEELIYRGVLFTRLIEATNNVHFSAIISAIIFAALHGFPVQILPIAAMGAILAYIYYYTRNIWYSVLMHFLINGVQVAIYFFWPGLLG